MVVLWRFAAEQIRDSNDIVEVIGSYIQVKRSGSNYRALCPFHKEKTPSFNVNQQRQIYHCFGCGVGGDVFKFVMEYENVDFSTAARMLAQRAGIHLEWTDSDVKEESNKDALLKLHEDIAMFYHRELLTSEYAAAAREYLKKREMDEQIIKDFLIGYAPNQRNALEHWAKKMKYSGKLFLAAGLLAKSDNGDYYARFRDRLMFPIRDELSRVIGFSGRILNAETKAAKYVNSPETTLFRKSRVLYALDRARRAIIDSRTAILCEGQIDVIRCHAAGIDTAIAAQGTALTEDHARLLKRYADSVIVVLDSDKAGENAALRSAEILLTAGLSIRIASLPEGEDPDSLIQAGGVNAFQQILDTATSALTFQIRVLRSREDLSNEASLIRAAREVLQTIAHAPSAIQQDQMIRQASYELGIGEEALRRDLVSVMRKLRHAPATPESEKRTVEITHPIEEVEMAELLAQHPETVGLVGDYLPLEYISDTTCRTIIEHLLRQPDDPEWSLLSELDNADEECRRLAAQVQMAPRKVTGEVAPEQAAKDLVLLLWRKTLSREREEIKRKMNQTEEKEKIHLLNQAQDITIQIKRLQRGWDQALDLISL